MKANMENNCTFSCRLEVLPGQRMLEKLENAQRYGFDAVSLPGRYLESYLGELRECLSASPLPIVSMSLGFTGSLVSPDKEIRKKCTESLLRLFDICAEVGAGVFNMPPVLIMDNPVRFDDPGSFPSVTEAQDALLLEQLPKIGDEARKRDVTLTLEPVNSYESEYLNSVAHATHICEQVGHENIGISADFFHMQMEELKTEQSLLAAGKWVRNVHVAENTRVEAGPGSMDFKPGFRALKLLGYRGYIILECRTLSGPAEDVLPKSVAYLRRLWEEA